ncbi:MAG: hypothetical protein E7332_00325 [Clostridiales bacterium]|nr:hypothetical protein [Clostridiales bacterium]
MKIRIFVISFLCLLLGICGCADLDQEIVFEELTPSPIQEPAEVSSFPTEVPTKTPLLPSPVPTIPAPTPVKTQVSLTQLEIFLALPRDEENVIIGSYEFSEDIELIVSKNGVNMRDIPSTEGKRISAFSKGQRVIAHGVENGWVKVTVLPGMFEGYIRSDFIGLYNPEDIYYANPIRFTVEVKEIVNGVEVIKKMTSNFVDVREYIPSIQTYIVFATPDNYTGKTLYARDICLLEQGTAKKLKKAQELFMKDGYSIKVYDAYRPSTVSGIIHDFVGDSAYAADYGKSTHNRGAAVDITLVDMDGNELEMPSGVMELNEKAHRNNKNMSEEAKKNMDYLTEIMTSCGFRTYSKEWWHFTDTQVNQYPASDLDFTKIYYELPEDRNGE